MRKFREINKVFFFVENVVNISHYRVIYVRGGEIKVIFLGVWLWCGKRKRENCATFFNDRFCWKFLLRKKGFFCIFQCSDYLHEFALLDVAILFDGDLNMKTFAFRKNLNYLWRWRLRWLNFLIYQTSSNFLLRLSLTNFLWIKCWIYWNVNYARSQKLFHHRNPLPAQFPVPQKSPEILQKYLFTQAS